MQMATESVSDVSIFALKVLHPTQDAREELLVISAEINLSCIKLGGTRIQIAYNIQTTCCPGPFGLL